MSAESGIDEGRRLVVFHLGDEEYGVPITLVQEIIRHTPPRPVPGSAPHVRGVINLRGRIIPVVDLRDRFGMREGDLTKASRIVVADAGGNRVGLVVDGVSEVLMVPTESIEPTPEVAANADHEYLRGIAKLGERMIILLSLDGLFGASEQAVLADAAA